MKKNIILLVLLSITVHTYSQRPMEIILWPDGAPNTNDLTAKEQELSEGRVGNVTNPAITVYTPAEPNGMAIIMCPGGGYSRLAMNHEGHDMANWFTAQGITYIVLKYRMPNGHHEVPLSDAEQAMRIVRRHAAEWKLNLHRIGIMGASAGGHLASTLATHFSSEETRPDFQILLYPVITMDDKYTHSGSRNNLLGKNPAPELIDLYSNERQIKTNTPPAFIALSSDDKTVTPINTVSYYLGLVEHKIPASLHAYPTGGHGWGFRDSFIYKRQWTEELEKWLRNEINN